MKKKDLSLLRQLKREEEKAKQQIKVEEVEQPVEEQKISFDLWWAEVNKKLNLPAYLKEIIWADFKGRGLKKDEAAAKYNDAIRLFGYKV
jgi:hypothetical protein